MSIRPQMIIPYLSIIPYLGLTNTSNLKFIRCYNVQLESYQMVVIASISAPSWRDDERA